MLAIVFGQTRSWIHRDPWNEVSHARRSRSLNSSTIISKQLPARRKLELAHKYSSPDRSIGPQTPELPCVPWVPQAAKPPDTVLTRYSLDSALTVSANSAKADQPKPPAAIPGFFTQQAQQLVQLSVFGEDYVADKVTEVFYIGGKPARPLWDDGVIKIPDLDHPGKFQDGFKVDMSGTWFLERALRDLHADKNVVCCQRRKVTSCTADTTNFASQIQCCTFPQSVLMAPMTHSMVTILRR